MTSDYTVIETVPSAEDFCRLRRISGMSPRPLEGVIAGLPRSCYGVHILWQGIPVGMGRIVGDGAVNFEIVDVAVDPAHHLSIVKSIVGNLKVLEESGMFDDIGLYSRSEQRLFSSADDEEPASEALERILFGAWTAEESAHYEYLKQRLEQAKALK